MTALVIAFVAASAAVLTGFVTGVSTGFVAALRVEFVTAEFVVVELVAVDFRPETGNA